MFCYAVTYFDDSESDFSVALVDADSATEAEAKFGEYCPLEVVEVERCM